MPLFCDCCNHAPFSARVNLWKHQSLFPNGSCECTVGRRVAAAPRPVRQGLSLERPASRQAR
eukprot:303886-Chlamydomonas_euryale.AAC.1